MLHSRDARLYPLAGSFGLVSRSLRATFLLLWILAPASVSGQGIAARTAAYPVGLSMAYGAGHIGLRDENISNQRYAGTLPCLTASWAADHARYVYRVGIELRHSDRIRNHSVSADITQFVLGQAFLYPLPSRKIMGRTVLFFAGPLTEVALYLNQQHIAVDALGFAQSLCLLLSLGAQADALLPLTPRFTLHGSLRSSLLSLGVRGVDDEIDDASPAKLLTPWSGTHASLAAGVLYRFSGRFAVGVSYLFQLTRVTAWHPLLSASDSLIARLTCRL